jgi:hypothetical protein
VYPTKELYLGALSKGKKTGVGLYIYDDGSYYFGSWSNDVMHGDGTLV